MKIKNIIATLLILFSTISYSQKEKIVGEWLLTKVEVNDEVHEPFFITDLKPDGKMEVMGMEAGIWELDEKADKIVMKSELDKDFNGDNIIVSISKKELVVIKGEAKLFYTKINQAEIEKENTISALVGDWKLQNEFDKTQLLQINLPDTFKLTEISSGGSTTTKGTWIYNSTAKSVIFIGMSRLMKGKSAIKEISENKLVLEKNGRKLIGKKQPSNNKIERLNFTYDDFPEEQIETSPWQDFDALLEGFKNVHHLKFKQGKLIVGTNSFIYNTLLTTVSTNSEKRSVKLTNFSITQNDTIQYSESYKGNLYNEYNNFFPEEEPGPYKIVKSETITVPAGTFNCKVIEGLNGEIKVKYWMILNKPGVYAKIISEELSVFDELEYSIIELEEIK